MNCKQGDLAIYVGSVELMRGIVYRCIARSTEAEHHAGEAAWVVDRKHMFGHDWVRDSSLRPIRPGDISDEEVRDLYLPKVPELA